MQIEITPIVETLDLDIGGRLVKLEVEHTEGARKRMGAVFVTAAQRIGFQEALHDNAIARGDGKAAEKCRSEIADAIEFAIAETFGKEKYDELLDAITVGHPERRSDCTSAFTEVMNAVNMSMTKAREREQAVEDAITDETRAKADELVREGLAESGADVPDAEAAKARRLEAATAEYMAAMRDIEGDDVAHPVPVEAV